MRKIAIRWIDHIRQLDMDVLEGTFALAGDLPLKLLEIGGGNGFVASKLSGLGFNVVSIDPDPRQPSFYHVRQGDCVKLEFPDDSFDIIFSSNVLEHVEDIKTAFAEMKRVLRPEGIMIHTMPTPLNTVLTFLTQPVRYIFGLGFVFGQAYRVIKNKLRGHKNNNDLSDNLSSDSDPKKLNRQNMREVFKHLNPLRILIPWHHGASPSCFTELHDWKRTSWIELFESNGFAVEQTVDLPLAYSRNVVFPFCFEKLRKHIAESISPSCRAYIAKPEL
ncbi:MAG: methyltransferase domain-containing protein [Planctomycetes bacterium]|nr:methyltransferase domain-containing protein [Planctomycetota bacterium]